MTITLMPQTARLAQLIDALRPIVAAGGAPLKAARAVASVLQPALRQGDLLPIALHELLVDVERQYILHVEPNGGFAIVARVLPPGQATPIHAYDTWCADGVRQGSLHETLYALIEQDGQTWLEDEDTLVNSPGAVSVLAPHAIHRTLSGGHGPAISIHVYGADISAPGAAGYRCYDLEVREWSEPAATHSFLDCCR